ncbi:MAG: acyltransferase [Pedobacter sp.]|nr:MAG: acyltransferase [Pedobacter sp.]
MLALTRFLLAFIVLVGHLSKFTDIGLFKYYNFLGSFEAILGFLLISGLSIGKSISTNKASYFKRRMQRIYPIYFASILLVVVLFTQPFSINYVAVILLNVLFLNQALTTSSLVGPAWTLAVEVWLYALAPVFLKLSLRQLYTIIYFSFFCYCLYTCGRSLYHWNYYSGTTYGINLILLAFIWVAGFALAVFPDKKKNIAIHIAFILAAHIGLSFLIQGGYRYKNQQLPLFLHEDLPKFIARLICLIWVYIVVIYNYSIPTFSTITNRVFNLLGNISYPLYLIHSTIFKVFEKNQISNFWVLLLGALLASYLFFLVFDFYSKKRTEKKPSALLAA